MKEKKTHKESLFGRPACGARSGDVFDDWKRVTCATCQRWNYEVDEDQVAEAEAELERRRPRGLRPGDCVHCGNRASSVSHTRFCPGPPAAWR